MKEARTTTAQIGRHNSVYKSHLRPSIHFLHVTSAQTCYHLVQNGSMTMASSPPVSVDAKAEAFMTWLQKRPGATINPKVQVADLRARNAGRGVGRVHLGARCIHSHSLIILQSQSQISKRMRNCSPFPSQTSSQWRPLASPAGVRTLSSVWTPGTP